MTLFFITDPSASGFFSGIWTAQAALSAFFAILFLQSGLDKVFDFSGNLGWLREHFAPSPLRNMVPTLLMVITAVELLAGALSAIGAAEAVLLRSYTFGRMGLLVSVLALLMLFFGQRMAKDYGGAASLVPYFIAAVLGLWMIR